MTTAEFKKAKAKAEKIRELKGLVALKAFILTLETPEELDYLIRNITDPKKLNEYLLTLKKGTMPENTANDNKKQKPQPQTLKEFLHAAAPAKSSAKLNILLINTLAKLTRIKMPEHINTMSFDTMSLDAFLEQLNAQLKDRNTEITLSNSNLRFSSINGDDKSKTNTTDIQWSKRGFKISETLSSQDNSHTLTSYVSTKDTSQLLSQKLRLAFNGTPQPYRIYAQKHHKQTSKSLTELKEQIIHHVIYPKNPNAYIDFTDKKGILQKTFGLNIYRELSNRLIIHKDDAGSRFLITCFGDQQYTLEKQNNQRYQPSKNLRNEHSFAKDRSFKIRYINKDNAAQEIIEIINDDQLPSATKRQIAEQTAQAKQGALNEKPAEEKTIPWELDIEANLKSLKKYNKRTQRIKLGIMAAFTAVVLWGASEIYEDYSEHKANNQEQDQGQNQEKLDNPYVPK